MRAIIVGISVALSLTLSLHPHAGAAQDRGEGRRPFGPLAGSWSGGGTLTTSSGTRERLRCRAHYSVGHGGRSLQLGIRCAGDSYRFDLASSVVARRGRISDAGASRATMRPGTVSGTASGDRIRALAHGNTFSAGLALTTRGNRQSVTITPQGTAITGVHLSLQRR